MISSIIEIIDYNFLWIPTKSTFRDSNNETNLKKLPPLTFVHRPFFDGVQMLVC